jgi:hypothetical protein
MRCSCKSNVTDRSIFCIKMENGCSRMNDEQASQQPKVVAAMEDKEKERKKTDLTKKGFLPGQLEFLQV